MIIPPTLKQLRYLVSLAEQRHFGRAAEACFVTQSTLSAGIQELEAILEVSLVDRSKKAVLFTPLGEELVERARRVLREADELVELAKASKDPLTGRLRLGVIPTIGPFLLPRILPALRRKYPKLRLYLREDLTGRLVQQLDSGRLDLLLLALPCDCGDAETVPLFDDPFSVAVPADHALATANAVSSARLDSENLLLLEDGHCLRDHALAACNLAGSKAGKAFEATSLLTLVQMVDNGLGITLLPRMAVDAGILNGTGLALRHFDDEKPSRQIGLAWRRNASRRDEFRLLADFLRNHGPANAAGSPTETRDSLPP